MLTITSFEIGISNIMDVSMIYLSQNFNRTSFKARDIGFDVFFSLNGVYVISVCCVNVLNCRIVEKVVKCIEGNENVMACVSSRQNAVLAVTESFMLVKMPDKNEDSNLLLVEKKGGIKSLIKIEEQAEGIIKTPDNFFVR